MKTEIVEAARDGDPAAFAAIVDEFSPTVLAAAYGWCGDRHLAADVAQQVFLTAYLKLHTLREPAALPGWLMAVTRTEALRALRSQVAPAPLEPSATAEVDEVEAAIVAADEARRVRSAVEALPAAQRLPLVLHYFAGRPLADIAELLGVPLSTVKKRMRDGRARLRTGGILMDDATTGALRDEAAARGGDPSDAVRVFAALRTGKPALLAALLDARPDLVDVREGWSRDEGLRHRLPWTQAGGTPLLRAVERGDAAMVELLLSRGADPNGACTCAGSETPVWVAALQRDLPSLRLLLARGADPNRAAFAGLTPLDVAIARGYAEIADCLRGAGASASTTRRFPPPRGTEAAATGIKTIDLWCPLPARGLVHMEFGYGLGAMVLLAELSRRAAARGAPVVWSGFVPRPLDLGDLRHVLAETDLTDTVTLALADPSAPAERQTEAFAAGIAAAGPGALLVVFGEIGFRHAIEERLFELADRDGQTIVVSPLDGDAEIPRPGSGPYAASIVFDRRRAQRGRWPAVGAASWSRVASPRIADLAARARQALSDELDAYLCQPFHVAEHVHAGPGETVSVDDLAADVTRLLGLGVAPDEAESGLRGSSFTASRPDRRRSPGTRRA